MNIGIIGLGLIGGSISLGLRKSNFGDKFIGTDYNKENALHAVKLGIVDEIIPLQDLILQSSVIILSIPVDGIEKILPSILHKIRSDTVILDTGSTKYEICNSVYSHPKRSRFVATHPIAGIEKSGPIFANSDLFYKKNCIFCDSELSDPDAISIAEKIYSVMDMRMIYLTSQEHDFYISYISHLPHVVSFSLASTVLKRFKEEEIFNSMKGSGLDSTTRLAKSKPETWLPIFISNRNNLIQAVDIYIDHLKRFRKYLKNKEFHKIDRYIKKANDIKEKICIN
ncbi:MAG: prephenate dehydrogenase [Flavobacteriales bacterium]|jgi:prephenate dehydrogenase|uniref:prephenate dehydrogenase n=1 Tax=Blattabacterium sp. (Mastotermes darwiniensis) TaxID=39768 RepID=UPI000231DF76|nr:prephenate dehydrogenase [Blattabacterium sp. (Mastotermes darwiniensis)]AER40398.1 prephenate dehydrogenase [Blattabacterium sp. (Mastotermes darwiniensis) str. MADAR]MDR1804881.1 prephenate dehydrogenase [Flavobacteriales bacterium]